MNICINFAERLIPIDVYRNILSQGYLFANFVLSLEAYFKKINMVQKTYFKTKDYCKVKFTVNAENAETIEILGLNSDWENSVVMSKKKDGSFSCELSLPKGSQHQFKYRVNETLWVNEPEADSTQPNEFGGLNSVIVL
jgi:1,4-alpha-glucan branching enzyme